MDCTTPILLASYPRSGNTMLRTVLWHCFGLRSGTIYPNEFSGNKELADCVGHIEKMPGGQIRFPKDNLPLVKTHEHCPNNKFPAIYIVRDGRATSVSLAEFYNGLSLEAVIDGKHRFGTWAAHLESWKPWERPNTLFLKYEEMVTDLPSVLTKISEFLKRPIIKDSIPDRNTIAEMDGHVIRKKSNCKSRFPDELTDKFLQINGDMLKKMGYLQ